MRDRFFGLWTVVLSTLTLGPQATGPLGELAIAQETKFEEVSIRPSPPLPGIAGTPFGLSAGAAFGMGSDGCRETQFQQFQLNPSRFVATRITLAGLIGLAYGDRCLSPDVFSGAPGWVKSDFYEVQALIPIGSPPYTGMELVEGKAPALQKMLQNMLASRFKLSLRRSQKEMAVYNLIAVKPEKWTRASLADAPPSRSMKMDTSGLTINFRSISMAGFASFLQDQLGRPVIDKTNATGLYDFSLTPPRPSIPVQVPAGAGADFAAQLLPIYQEAMMSILEDQAGLKLESSRAMLEVLVVERAERPTENGKQAGLPSTAE
jgi:uncharacterized protein (TIGR03435 family)